MNVSSLSSGACHWLAAIVTVGIGCVDSGPSISVVWLSEVSSKRIQFTVTHLVGLPQHGSPLFNLPDA